MKTVDAARGKWRGILMAIGIDEHFLQNRHGPCPCCGGNDRFRYDDKDGNGTYYCNHCGAGDGIKLAQAFTGQDFQVVATRIDSLVGNITPDKVSTITDAEKLERAKARLKRIQAELLPAAGTPVETYLNSRGLELTPALKHHPNFPYWEHRDGKMVEVGRFNAMVSRFVLPDGQPATFHVTFLTSDGRKADVPSQKKILTPITAMDGGAVRLFPVAEHIGIAEGIENALACRKIYGLPVLATLNELMLRRFVPPEGVKRVTIFGDKDSTYVGDSAAYSLARDLASKKYAVDVIMPKEKDKDFNDVLLDLLAE